MERASSWAISSSLTVRPPSSAYTASWSQASWCIGMVSNPNPLPVAPILFANGASISCFHSMYARCLTPCPTRKAALWSEAKRSEPSPSRLPSIS